jgi:glycosyltransferase involved in cell wall biosynthesis/peptidoglycan/xylan/chitin deacetylase (PgdA/CDA1 family)
MVKTRKPAEIMGGTAGKAGPRDKTGLSFTIIIPTFERRDVVVDAVKTLSALEYSSSIEVIVVVDGSTDGTAAALAGLKLPFPVRVIEQANKGAAGARNFGAAEATGDILLFLDDDMFPHPDLVEQHARMYREGADAVVGRIPVDPSSPPGFVTDSVVRWLENSRVGPELTPFDIFTGQLSVRRSVFETLGGFDEDYTSGPAFRHEDTEFGVRLLAEHVVRYNPEAISSQRYVVRPREIIRRASQAAASDLRFASRHPQFSRLLFGHRRIASRRVRYLYRPLSRVPLLPKVTAALAIVAADVILKTRFRSNRVASKFFGFAQGLSYWSAMRAHGGLSGRRKLLVLCYHAIEDQADDPVLAPYGVAPEAFEEQLQWLAARGSTFVSANALASFLENGSPLPRRSVLLTFDDCYSGLLDVVETRLRPRGIDAIAFAVTGMKSGTNEWDQRLGSNRLQLLDGDGLRQLQSLGVEVGCHSRTHREMPLLADDELKAESGGAADDLVLTGLPRPRFFAYPYGSRDKRSIEAVQTSGYLAAFGCRPGCVTPASDRYDLPRVSVFAYDTGWRFRLRVSAPRLLARLEWLHRGIGAKVRAAGRKSGGSQ